MFGLGLWTIFLNDIALSNDLQERLRPFSIGAFSSIDVSSEDSFYFHLLLESIKKITIAH
jgi:hypothetical protein